MSDDIITTFGIEQDTQSINKAFDTVSNLDDNIKKVGKSALQTADDISRISQVTQQIPDDPFAARLASPEAIQGAFPQAQQQLKQPLDDAEADLGRTAGAINGLSGAVSALGGEAGQAAAPILSTAAAVPDLIDNVGNLASQFTLTGGIITGVLVAALTIGALALSDLAKASKEMAEQVQREIDQERALAEARGMTTSEIEAQIDEIEKQIKAEQDVLAETQKFNDALREGEKQARDIAGPFYDIGKAFNVWGQSVDVASDNLDEQNKTVKDLQAEHEALTEALNSQEVAANDARQALLDEVDAQAELDRFRNRALQNTAEQNAELARQIEEERAIKQRQIATLKASGDTDKEVQDRIKELTGELQELDQQSAVLSSSAVKASEAQKEQAKAADAVSSAAKEAAKAQDAVKKAERDRIKELQSGMMELAQLEAENRNAIIEERKAGLSQFKELIDKQFADSIAAEEKRQQELNKIAERGRKDALRQSEEFDFLGAFRTRQTTAEQLKEAESAANEQRRIQEQNNARERIALLQKINEELALKQAQFDAEVEQQTQELLLQQIESQNEIDELRKTANEKNRILQQAGNEEIKIANRIAQAQVDIAGQALQALNQLQQTAVQQVQSIQNQVTNIGSVSNTLLPNVTGNLSGALGSATVQQMQAMLNQFSQLTTQGF